MRTIIILLIFTFQSIAQTPKSVFQRPDKKTCNGTISKNTKDSLFIAYSDTCTGVVFDTLFNGVYVFLRTPSKRVDRIVTFKDKKFHGQQIEYYANGKIFLQGQNKNFQRQGKWTEYYETGEIKCISNYKKGNIQTQKCFDKNGKQVADIIECYRYLD
jgi:antitoxin component YwqK of YwqJK toxin-antitoxin module